jgi:hypothetical protein
MSFRSEASSNDNGVFSAYVSRIETENQNSDDLNATLSIGVGDEFVTLEADVVWTAGDIVETVYSVRWESHVPVWGVLLECVIATMKLEQAFIRQCRVFPMSRD